MRRRVAVVGVGAIGSVAAALAEKAGHEVVLCVRSPLPDLVVESAAGAMTVQGRRVLDPAEAEPVDWILVATKAYDANGAAEWLPRLGASGAPVAVLQNGVEHVARFSRLVDPARILPAIVECPVERPERSRVRQRGTMQIKVPEGAAGAAFAALFLNSGAQVTPVADFVTAAWRKLALNAAGVLCALTRKPVGIFHDDAVAAAGRQIVRECVAVARAEGAQLDDSVADEVLAICRGQPRDSVNSLLADVLAGRRTEIDARNGVIVRLGSQHGIATPANALAVAVVQTFIKERTIGGSV